MTMKKFTQKGFGHFGLLLLVLVIVVVGLIGYKVWNNSKSQPTVASISSRNGQAINSTADLNRTESSLNGANIDGDLDPGSLNQDVQSLL
jgi:predicted negative regulator of RcsB-dependent stress response